MSDEEGKKSHPANAGERDSQKDSGQPPATELTPEEQMAQFEEALKDEDWGHQPC